MSRMPRPLIFVAICHAPRRAPRQVTDQDVRRWYDFALKWAKRYARANGLLAHNADEVESRAGLALTKALRAEATITEDWQAYLEKTIKNELHEGQRDETKQTRLPAKRVHAGLTRGECYRPAAAKKDRRPNVPIGGDE